MKCKWCGTVDRPHPDDGWVVAGYRPPPGGGFKENQEVVFVVCSIGCMEATDGLLKPLEFVPVWHSTGPSRRRTSRDGTDGLVAFLERERGNGGLVLVADKDLREAALLQHEDELAHRVTGEVLKEVWKSHTRTTPA